MRGGAYAYAKRDSFIVGTWLIRILDTPCAYEVQDVCIDVISMVQRVVMRYRVLQCVAVCRSVLQCAAVWCNAEFDNGDLAEYDRYGAAYCNAL